MVAKFLGEIRQLGYVVPDVEASMNYWINERGVGPFYYNEKVIAKDYMYRGESYDPQVSVGMANMGAIQIELIEPRDDLPSMYRDFLNDGLVGLQHFAFWTEDFDAEAALAVQSGFTSAQSGVIGPRGRFVYFEKNPNADPPHP